MSSTVNGSGALRPMMVFGTRPEAIKLLEVIRTLRDDARFEPTVIATGQHREMVAQILSPFAVTPDRDLDIMAPGQSLNDIVSRSVPALDELYAELCPDVVIVQGDTTSAFCAALAAFNRRIPVAHVEAGLRSYDRGHPYPEETNRRMLSTVADLHFAPTAAAAANLVDEGIRRDDIVVSGNTVVDTLLTTLGADLAGELLGDLPAGLGADAPLVLVTLHRRESWSAPKGADGREGHPSTAPLFQILHAIRRVALARPDVQFVYPVHLNPRVQKPAREILGDLPNVELIPPLSYIPFVHLMARADLIVSDSGGVQEEAPSLGIPVLILRETTERPEAVKTGQNRLVGTCPKAIEAALLGGLNRDRVGSGAFPYANPYGDGLAHRRIAQAILHRFGRGERPLEFTGAVPPIFPETDLTNHHLGVVYG